MSETPDPDCLTVDGSKLGGPDGVSDGMSEGDMLGISDSVTVGGAVSG